MYYSNVNYWYYTLSAVPQTLAAMMALGATFAVFKLSSISSAMKDVRVSMRRFILLSTSRLQNTPKEIDTIEALTNAQFLSLLKKGWEAIKDLPGDDALFKKLQEEMYRVINEEWHSFYSPKGFRVKGYFKRKLEEFGDQLEKRSKILKLLMQNSICVGFVAVSSLVLLPSAEYFDGSMWIVGAVLFSATLSFIVTLLSIYEIVSE